MSTTSHTPYTHVNTGYTSLSMRLAREAEPRTVLRRLTYLTWTAVLTSDYDFRFDLLSVAYNIMAAMQLYHC